jgi:tetratricopeptide (TPR) repeat protein
LVPVIGLVQVGSQAMADRYAYIPLVGIFIAVTWGVAELTRQWPSGKQILLRVILSALIILYASIAWKQTTYWRDSLTLFERALTVTRDNYIAHLAYGKAFYTKGQLQKAIIEYKKSLAIRPYHDTSLINYGIALTDMKMFDEARLKFILALEKNPGNFAALKGIGYSFLLQDRPAEAERYFRDAQAAVPEEPLNNTNLGVALALLGREREAIFYFEKALSKKPNDPAIHENLGQAFEALGDKDQATYHFEIAKRLEPDIMVDHQRKVSAGNRSSSPRSSEISELLEQAARLEQLNKFPEAQKYYEEALRLDPENIAVHNNFGISLAEAGRLTEAISHFETALRIAPDDRSARENLARALRLKQEQ